MNQKRLENLEFARLRQKVETKEEITDWNTRRRAHEINRVRKMRRLKSLINNLDKIAL
jgi:hypothetical protein